MKRFLVILKHNKLSTAMVIISCAAIAMPVFAVSLPGAFIGSTITVGDTSNTYAIADTNYLQGGLHSYDTIAGRNAITVERRHWGMLATVNNDGGNNGTYQLRYNNVDTDITNNANWVLFTGSGLTLQTDGVSNGSQSILNLVGGSNITLTDNGSGSVTIDASGGGGGGNGDIILSGSSYIGINSGPNGDGTEGGTTNSFIVGLNAGSNVGAVDNSVFFGDSAGSGALNASNSFFVGAGAGVAAQGASDSVFIGYLAGLGSTNANDSIFIGRNAGTGDAVNNTSNGWSILIGKDTSTGGFSNSIALGGGAINTQANEFALADAIRYAKFRGVSYEFPSTQASLAGQVLTNDGNGLLSWGSASGLTLQTEGTQNGSQSLLNLAAGTNISLSDNGSGTVTINATGGGSQNLQQVTDSGNTTTNPIILNGVTADNYLNILSPYGVDTNSFDLKLTSAADFGTQFQIRANPEEGISLISRNLLNSTQTFAGFTPDSISFTRIGVNPSNIFFEGGSDDLGLLRLNNTNLKVDLFAGGGTQIIVADNSGLLSAQPFGGGTGSVTSVDISVPSAFTVSGNPITTSGTIAIAGAGTTDEYIRGDGSLGTLSFVPGTSGNDFNVSSSGSTYTFNIPTASASSRGLLSLSDWTTFNNKQSLLVSGTNIKTINNTSILGSGNLDVGASQWTTSGSDIYYATGNVGIGSSSTPTQRLDVTGAIKFSGALMPNNLPGLVTDVLTSTGSGTPPVWTIKGEYLSGVMRINLKLINDTSLDGALVEWGIAYNDAFSLEDAAKAGLGSDNSIATYVGPTNVNSNILSVNRRKGIPGVPDIVNVIFPGTNYFSPNYRLSFQNAGTVWPLGSTVYLVDTYLNTRTDISAITTTNNVINYDFDVNNSDPATKSATRFKIYVYPPTSNFITGTYLNNKYENIKLNELTINGNTLNIFGKNAGLNAIRADNSNFFGIAAGSGAATAANSIFIGTSAGLSDSVNNTQAFDDSSTFANTSILIGHKTSTGGFSNSIALGAYATNTAANQFLIGSTNRPIDTMRINGSASTQCTITTGTGIACTSDERLKTNVLDLDDTVLAKLLKVRTVTYNWLENPNSPTQIGFLAQDLEQYFPQLVSTDAQGYKSVYYAQMTPIIVKAIQDISIQVAQLPILEDKTLGEKIALFLKGIAEEGKGMFESIVTKKATIDEVQTQQLCVGTDADRVCINASQLQQLLTGNAVSPTPASSPENETPSDTPTPEPVPDPAPSDAPGETSPVAEPTPEPSTPPEELTPPQEQTPVEPTPVETPAEPAQ